MNAGKTPEKEPIPEELLLEFEKNFRARSHGLRNALIAATAVCLLGGGFWWWNSQVPSPETAKRTASAPHSGPAQETMPRKAVAPPAAQPPVAAPSPRPEPLPSFVPSREDVSYASARPGWQRYVDSERDVRIFRSGGSIKAVQVVSVPGKILDDTQLAAVLKELTGSSDRILGKSEKRKGYRGYLIQQGTAGAGAELVVYRRQHPEGIVAFVVSLK